MVGGLWLMAGRGRWFCTTSLFYAAIKSCCGCGSEEVVHSQHRYETNRPPTFVSNR